ncbi:6275_t:CDS:2 [Funneliformis geosporum]|uniref:protein-serine/threonine phosphatase n=1 Tax=Funneliformis geosporum TaxID=1117311 RepID=A0A9W4SH48_9GLOM|nr:6275_t:CDS:2 [Funneliformis geosporum]CAI2169489.1 6407_t:CDS:2 [Funneliformis geosporum]
MSLIDLDVGVANLKGDREEQLDRFDVRNHYFHDQGYSLFIIYDGHGDMNFSKHAKENLADLIVNDYEFKNKNYEKAFVNGFKQEDYLLRLTFGTQKQGGTTATAALFLRNSDTFYIANVGDSSAVLGTRPGRNPEAIPVSTDDKTDDKVELERLAKAHANVRRGRLLRQGHSVNMTRGSLFILDVFYKNLQKLPLGDFDFKAPSTPTGQDWITPVPHTYKIDLIPHEDEFLVIASDGLWNVYDEQTVVEAITDGLDKGYDVHQLSNALAATAINHSKPSDNVTVMLIFFVWDNNSPPE